MKKKLIFLTLLSSFIFVLPLNASTGLLKTNSIVSCDGVFYGAHGNDNHYHLAEETENGKYKAKGDSLGTNWTCNGTLKDLNEDKILEKVTTELASCVDGDTAVFKINGAETKFRFLAIDTPETVHPTKEVEEYGKTASEYTCTKLTEAKTIEIEYEDSKTDKYGRSLGWIWIDGSLLQEELIQEGLGEVAYIYGNYKYTRKLCETQSKAKQNQNGIWASGTRKEGYCSTLNNSNEQNEKVKKQEKSKNYTNETITGSIIIILAILIKLLKK